MKTLSVEQKQQISSRIREVEVNCNAELVTVIAKQSDTYLYIPLLWAALIALMLPGGLSLFNSPLTVGEVYLVQVALFMGAGLLLSLPAVKFRVVPRTVLYRRASRHAHQLFFIEGLHLTENRSGVMLFVSQNERYVEIICDHGISQHVEHEVWEGIVQNFIRSVGKGEVFDGYMNAVNSSAALLQEYFPGETKNANELPDHLIEI